jgi:hypothetical protein
MNYPAKAITAYLAVPFLTASGTWFSVKAAPALVFLSALAAWLCYSKSHEMLTGDLVHSEDLGDDLAQTDTSYPMLLVGALVSAAAFPICVYGVNLRSFPLLSVGYLTFFAGYAVMHKARFDVFI